MAESSYPFAAASAGGGSPMVSQAQWQAMSHMWATDRIDFQLTNYNYASNQLPFYAELVGGNLVVQPGNAWTGGFYYKLDSAWSQGAPTNSGSQPRIDLLVLRANMSSGDVYLAVKQGQAAANPKEPTLTRDLGGNWEMPMWALRCEANNGARTLEDRRRFDGPGTIYTPWNRIYAAQNSPLGNFTVDMDSNDSGGMEEGFYGKDGDMITRTLGKRRAYTPDLLSVSNKPSAANRKGYYRYIAPGTVAFSAEIINTSSNPVKTTSGASSIGLTLPVNCSITISTILNGHLSNPEVREGMPNLVDVTCKTNVGTRNSYLMRPDYNDLSEGLNSLTVIPGKSALVISGVYETNDLD
ncbi:minor tail protein [Streptomyces phage Ibantik]|uniref:Minor tail protein n=1 Tax=Streptomyces phage Ibantik TaxID=2182397 RepID=A0A2U8UNJ6_9CAUD|nr:minor tail protein [Streptomyces phage Ibantik]AWN05304.1 minor tail protein [Streptomyces phage Ibantik]